MSVLLVFAVTGCGAASGEDKNTEEATYVHTFAVDDVTAFTYVYGEELLAFDLEDGTWVDMMDNSVKLDSKKTEGFLEEMSRLSALSVYENVEDASEYGVDDPTQMFAVVFSDGSSLTYCFGTADEKTKGVYLQVTDDADDTNNRNVYLVDATVVTDTMNHSMEDFQ